MADMRLLVRLSSLPSLFLSYHREENATGSEVYDGALTCLLIASHMDLPQSCICHEKDCGVKRFDGPTGGFGEL